MIVTKKGFGEDMANEIWCMECHVGIVIQVSLHIDFSYLSVFR